MIELRLGKPQLDDLKLIEALGTKGLSDIIDRLRKTDSVPLTTESLQTLMETAELRVNPEIAEALVRQAVGFHGISRQSGLPFEGVARGVRGAIERESGWNEAEIQAWREIEGTFWELLSLPAIETVAKAIDLSYEYQNLLRNARIITDIRPLFNSAGNAIQGAVVSFSLHLRFDSTEGDHELSIALDQNDVRNIAAQCERALIKAAAAEAVMKKTGIATIVSGRGADA